MVTQAFQRPCVMCHGLRRARRDREEAHMCGSGSYLGDAVAIAVGRALQSSGAMKPLVPTEHEINTPHTFCLFCFVLFSMLVVLLEMKDREREKEKPWKGQSQLRKCVHLATEASWMD